MTLDEARVVLTDLLARLQFAQYQKREQDAAEALTVVLKHISKTKLVDQ